MAPVSPVGRNGASRSQPARRRPSCDATDQRAEGRDNRTYPDGPAIGTLGERIEAAAAFDCRGYVDLYSSQAVRASSPELDTYAIDEGHDAAFATGYGGLTVHEVATDPQAPDRAYLSYYAGDSGAEIQNGELVGGYLDPTGNNFWGVEAFV